MYSFNSIGKTKKLNLPKETTIFVILIAMIIVLSLSTSKFFTGSNIANLLKQTAVNGVVAIGMTFVIISGGIDLSVGSTVGLSGIICALLMRDGMAIFPSVVIAIVVSTLIGLVNGALIFDGKVPPFIATLGVVTIVRGIIMLISNARMISGLPDDFSSFSQQKLFGLPMMVVVWIILLIIASIVLKFTIFGRNVYSIGSNEEATRLSGVNIRVNIYGIYVVSAFCSAVAGILMTTRLGNGAPQGGSGYELDAIAAAVVGGASLSGGEGSIAGTLIGALIMSTLRNGGNLLGANSFVLEICIGALIIIAVLIDKLKK
jgi:ribose/xylose/arabinose/galactoside ABC-type transport system permease subunit